MNFCSSCHSYFFFSMVKYKIGNDLILCESCYSIWKQKQLERSDKLVDGNNETRTYQDVVSVEKGEKAKTVLVVCPSCQKEFQYNVDIEKVDMAKEAVDLKMVCPHCNMVLTGTIQKAMDRGS